jgi:hypothetical protein
VPELAGRDLGRDDLAFGCKLVPPSRELYFPDVSAGRDVGKAKRVDEVGQTGARDALRRCEAACRISATISSICGGVADRDNRRQYITALIETKRQATLRAQIKGG